MKKKKTEERIKRLKSWIGWWKEKLSRIEKNNWITEKKNSMVEKQNNVFLKKGPKEKLYNEKGELEDIERKNVKIERRYWLIFKKLKKKWKCCIERKMFSIRGIKVFIKTKIKIEWEKKRE